MSEYESICPDCGKVRLIKRRWQEQARLNLPCVSCAAEQREAGKRLLTADASPTLMYAKMMFGGKTNAG